MGRSSGAPRLQVQSWPLGVIVGHFGVILGHTRAPRRRGRSPPPGWRREFTWFSSTTAADSSALFVPLLFASRLVAELRRRNVSAQSPRPSSYSNQHAPWRTRVRYACAPGPVRSGACNSRVTHIALSKRTRCVRADHHLFADRRRHVPVMHSILGLWELWWLPVVVVRGRHIKSAHISIRVITNRIARHFLQGLPWLASVACW